MNKIVLGIVAVVVLAFGVLLPVGKESRTIVERVVERDEVNSAVNSPDLSIGAFRLFSAGRDSFIQATSSIICSLQAPSSTSTLVHAGVQVTSATSSATGLFMSRSSAPFAVVGTNTTLSSTSVATGAYKTIELVSTTTVGAMVFAPNTYLTVSQVGGGILNQTGSCEAIWHVI